MPRHSFTRLLRAPALRRKPRFFVTLAGFLIAALLLPASVANANPSGYGLFVFGGQSQPITYSAPDSWGPNSHGSPVRWMDLEPSNGTFNWAPLDNILAQANTAGKKVVPRIYVNADGFFQATPTWFFALPGAQFYQTSFSAGNGIKLPIPWDTVFRTEFGQFLTAFGARYNGDARVEFIQSTAGGGLYGEIAMAQGCGVGGGASCPPGWSEATALSSVQYWVDRWRTAFPNKNLSLMVNDLGGGLMTNAANYAVTKKFFLQSNWRILSATTVNLYKAKDDVTKIVMEVENGGCVDNTLPGFQNNIVNVIFGYGFAIDYLSFCGIAFSNAPTASYIHNTLLPMVRKTGPGGV